MTAKEEIRSRALALGFSHAGFAVAEPLDRERARLRTWLDRGMHASMEWMRRTEETRGDPRRMLDGARTVVALAMNYFTPHRHTGGSGTGKVSRYAWGDDYHDVMGGRMRELLAWMEERFPGSRGVATVDAGPAMDKVWAERGGIGWIGKHTNVITRDAGSWVFLGEIITTLTLEPDEPATDHCGTCTLCIEACPTSAIVEPSVVDANRCLSYLTIEHRGEVDSAFHDGFDGWLFGCDVCQDVCPWNIRFARPTAEGAFEPREGHRKPSLAAWAAMTPEEFAERFRGSPIRRARHAGLMRTIGILRDNPRPDPHGTSPASDHT